MRPIEPNITTLDRGHEIYGGSTRRQLLVPVSLGLHALAAIALVVVPVLSESEMPQVSSDAVRAFFVQPASMPPPPPPPPPPAPAARAAAQKVTPAVMTPAAFVAPVDVPREIEAESPLSFGLEGGVAGGVEGGVPGGVIGGVVGGLPVSAPVEGPKVVRVGGAVKEPRKLKHIDPVYPELAVRARVEGLAILEARIAPNGTVGDVRVLRGVPMLEEAAADAVRRWIYTPTLIDGVPATALMTVTVRFRLGEETIASR